MLARELEQAAGNGKLSGLIDDCGIQEVSLAPEHGDSSAEDADLVRWRRLAEERGEERDRLRRLLQEAEQRLSRQVATAEALQEAEQLSREILQEALQEAEQLPREVLQEVEQVTRPHSGGRATPPPPSDANAERLATLATRREGGHQQASGIFSQLMTLMMTAMFAIAAKVWTVFRFTRL